MSQKEGRIVAESCQIRVLVPFSLDNVVGGSDILTAIDYALTRNTVDQEKVKERPPSPTKYDEFWMGGGWRRLVRASVADAPPATAHEFYTEDYLLHVQSFLFDGEGPAGTLYWQYFPSQASSWFNDSRLVITDRKRLCPGESERNDSELALRLSDDSGIELFVNRLGVGVLSVSFDLQGPIDSDRVGELNHALATGQDAVWVVKPDYVGYDAPDDGKLPDFQLRLTKGKHAFRFDELAEWFLAPIAAEFQIRSEPRHWVHTCLHFSRDWDFADEGQRGKALKVLSHLSQLHPASHPGEIESEGFGETAIINTRHIACIGLAGAAHAIARQEPESDGRNNDNDKRQRRRGHFHYFAGFLIASLQRLALQQILNRGRQLLEERRALQSACSDGASDEDKQKLNALDRHQAGLRWQMLSFCLEGEFVLVSPRRTVQNFHEITQRVSEVQEGMSTARRTLDDWESARQTEQMTASLHAMEELQNRSEKQSETMVESLSAIKQMQNKIEWLEVFIVLIYAIEGGHILAGAFGFSHSWLLGVSLIALSVYAAYIGYHTLRPHEHADDGLVERIKKLAKWLAIAFAIFIAFNFIVPPVLKHFGIDLKSHHGKGKTESTIEDAGPSLPHKEAGQDVNASETDSSTHDGSPELPPRD